MRIVKVIGAMLDVKNTTKIEFIDVILGYTSDIHNSF